MKGIFLKLIYLSILIRKCVCSTENFFLQSIKNNPVSKAIFNTLENQDDLLEDNYKGIVIDFTLSNII